MALGKTTEQSSTYVEYNATKAVDGYDSQKLSDCAHTGIYPKQNVAWWQVDIGEISEIKNIKIYYRDEGTIRRFDGFQLYSGENKQWMDKDQCYRDTEDGYSPSVVTVNCPGLAQYITIVNDPKVVARVSMGYSVINDALAFVIIQDVIQTPVVALKVFM
ncbi:hypothetical protein KUTeg_000085 [Tegillarca granosa]|uniref:F5/8 type C domain-containing protein n=1 Tax=Tegillarca granosa TaxID=220873 RepID=A0ABQ9FWM9_TEGGR|nr:hypothetical protein KUTeg_000085 [Tegillarca granosa]